MTGLRRLFPPVLLTDGQGPNQRLRVDVGQTGFFSGREFRSFKEWSVATTETYIVKYVSPVDVIIFEAIANGEAGSIRIENVFGGTEGGTFSEVLPIYSTNGMSEKPQPPYAAQVSLTAGGTLTGGLTTDVVRVKTSDNSNFGGSIGGNFGAERGAPPVSAYFRFTLTAFIGTFKWRWEERP